MNAMRENKGKLILTAVLVLIAISTGIFIAIKNNNSCDLGRLQEINLENFYSGFSASSSAFLSRCFSLLINFVVLLGLAFAPFLFPLALVLFVYRAYLFGLNFALIFIFYGLGGAITGIIVILPCQLAMLLVMVMFYLIFQRININRKKFGTAEGNRMIIIVVFLVILLLLNLAETLLLWVLNGKVIMVI